MAKRGRPTEWTEKRVEALANKLDEWRSSHTNFLLSKFCDEHDVYPALLSRLAKKHDVFSQALQRAKVHQEAVIVEGMLNSELNAIGSIFTLKNVAGWRDKKDIDHTSKGDKIDKVRVEVVNGSSQSSGD